MIELSLNRDVFNPAFTLGRLMVDGSHFGYTCEDTDRELEVYPERKIHGQSAVPRGRYRLTTSASQRFGKVLPILLDVPGFSGVRIHGGNTAADTEGCPLLGHVRTANGVANCAERVSTLTQMIIDEEAAGGQCWLIVQ